MEPALDWTEEALEFLLECAENPVFHDDRNGKKALLWKRIKEAGTELGYIGGCEGDPNALRVPRTNATNDEEMVQSRLETTQSNDGHAVVVDESTREELKQPPPAQREAMWTDRVVVPVQEDGAQEEPFKPAPPAQSNELNHSNDDGVRVVLASKNSSLYTSHGYRRFPPTRGVKNAPVSSDKENVTNTVTARASNENNWNCCDAPVDSRFEPKKGFTPNDSVAIKPGTPLVPDDTNHGIRLSNFRRSKIQFPIRLPAFSDQYIDYDKQVNWYRAKLEDVERDAERKAELARIRHVKQTDKLQLEIETLSLTLGKEMAALKHELKTKDEHNAYLQRTLKNLKKGD